MVTTGGAVGVLCPELPEDPCDGREPTGIRVVEHDLGDPAGGVVAQEGAVDERHAEPPTAEDRQSHGAPSSDRTNASRRHSTGLGERTGIPAETGRDRSRIGDVPPHTFDPLAGVRDGGDPQFDVFVQGIVFLDIVFTGLPELPEARHGGVGRGDGLVPRRHREPRRGRLPPRAAHRARGRVRRRRLRRLLLAGAAGAGAGRPVDVAALSPLAHAGHRLGVARPATARWSPHGHAAPEDATTMLGATPSARSVRQLDLDGDRPLGVGHPERAWAERAHEAGALLFADVGWDPTGAWSPTVLDQLALLPRLPARTPSRRWPTRAPTRPHDALYAAGRPRAAGRRDHRRDGALAIDSPPVRRRRCRPCGSRPSTPPEPATSSTPASSSARWRAGRCSSGSTSRRCARPGGPAVRRLARRPGLGRHRGLVAPRSGPSDGERGRPVRAAPVRLLRRPRRRGPTGSRAPGGSDDRQAVGRLRPTTPHHGVSANRGVSGPCRSRGRPSCGPAGSRPPSRGGSAGRPRSGRGTRRTRAH